MGNILEGLNNQQKEAVLHKEGAMLVLAGAGSGKTKVLTTRLAYLLENNIARPWNCLVVTFTNRAANEMKERVRQFIGDTVNSVWLGTFHSICGRILRQDIENYKNEEGIKWEKSFAIYDEDESLAIIKNALKVLDLDDKVYKPKTIKAEIATQK